MLLEQIGDIEIQSDESDEFINRLQISFGLSHEEMGMSSGMTLNELIENVQTKLNRVPSKHCTSQRVFYRVRKIFTDQFGFEKKTVVPESLLKNLLPKDSRRERIKYIEKHLSVSVKYFQVPNGLASIAVVVLLLSFIFLFFHTLILTGVFGILMSIMTLSISARYSVALPFKTIGEFANRIAIDNLVALQSNEKEINPREIRKVIVNTLQALHGLEEHEINFDQKLKFL